MSTNVKLLARRLSDMKFESSLGKGNYFKDIIGLISFLSRLRVSTISELTELFKTDFYKKYSTNSEIKSNNLFVVVDDVPDGLSTYLDKTNNSLIIYLPKGTTDANISKLWNDGSIAHELYHAYSILSGNVTTTEDSIYENIMNLYAKYNESHSELPSDDELLKLLSGNKNHEFSHLLYDDEIASYYTGHKVASNLGTSRTYLRNDTLAYDFYHKLTMFLSTGKLDKVYGLSNDGKSFLISKDVVEFYSKL